MLSGLAGPVSEEQRRQLTMITNSGRHLLELINGVLDLAKIESGQTALVPQAVDPCEVVHSALDVVRPLAMEKSIEIEADCSAEPLSLVTDRTRLHQILLNLLGNAVKFTDSGRIIVRVRREGADVLIDVEDSGRGIAAEDAPHVFERFYQGRPENGGKTVGTGLGLSLSLSLARMMGGDITMSSTPGAGSTFTLRLPAGV